MPAVSRKGDSLSTGHICTSTTTLDTPGQGTCFANSILIAKDLNDLGDVYVSLNKYIEAETVFLRSLALREKILGLNDSITVNTLVDLGNLYSVQGLYNKSEQFLLRALAFREKTLEPNHYKIGELLNTLGVLYTRQGSHSKGESFYLRAISIYKNTGKLNQSFLGEIFLESNQYNDAIKLFKNVLKINEKNINALLNLGKISFEQGNFEISESYYNKINAHNKK